MVAEACDEGQPGFSGGWISSIAVSKLFKPKLTPHKVHDIVRGMGYIKHPGLIDGRVNNTILYESGKPRLYIRKGHILGNITGAADIARRYCEAQGYSVATPGAIRALP
jgi:hypothetical protein